MLLKDIINIDKEILHGTPVFKNTRVPVQTLFDHLEESSLEEFLKASHQFHAARQKNY